MWRESSPVVPGLARLLTSDSPYAPTIVCAQFISSRQQIRALSKQSWSSGRFGTTVLGRLISATLWEKNLYLTSIKTSPNTAAAVPCHKEQRWELPLGRNCSPC